MDSRLSRQNASSGDASWLMKVTECLKSEAQFDSLLVPYRKRADQIMVGMNLFLLAVSIGLASWHNTWLAVLLVGVPTAALAIVLARGFPGTLVTRLFMAAAFMIFTGLIIHQSAGQTEAHFAAFGLIGVLLYYRDWRTIALATAVIYGHHFILGYIQTLGLPVYVFQYSAFWSMFWTHIAYFLPFVLMMGYLSIWLRREGWEDQHVARLAENIIRGDFISERQLPGGVDDAPLIRAVVIMKNRLLDLIRVMPVPAAVIRLDTESMVYVNEAWKKNLGDTPIGTGVDQTPIDSTPGTWNDMLTALRASTEQVIDKQEYELRLPGGRDRLFEVSVVLHEEAEPVMAILTLEDITERRRTEQTMRRLAFNDLLTGLPNRARLLQVLEQGLEAWRIRREPMAMLLIDLDGFKPVNDTWGHDAGDEVLKVIAQRLTHGNKATDIAARLGGDEFVLVLKGCKDGQGAARTGERLLEHLRQPIALECAEGQVVAVNGSIGVTHVSCGATNVEVLLKQADLALYLSKEAGKGQVRMFEPSEETERTNIQ